MSKIENYFDSSRHVAHESVRAPAPFLQITPHDKADAMRNSELVRVMLSFEDHNLRYPSVKQLLQNSEDTPDFVNARDTRGRTPLMHAIADGASDILSLLIERSNVDLLSRDRFGNTALMYAVGHGYENMVRTLLNCLRKRIKDDDRIMLNYLHMENYDGENAMELALKAGHEECALALSDFLNDALRKEKARKTSIAYRLGFGKRSPPIVRKVSNGRKNGYLNQTPITIFGRRKSSGDINVPSIFAGRRKSSD